MFKKFVLILMALTLALTCCTTAFAEELVIEWFSVEEAREMFQEALGQDCTFEVTCRTAYRVDGSTKGWLQMEAMFASTGAATGLWNCDIVMSLSVLEALSVNGAIWEENGFIINPVIFPHDTPNELVLEEDWGMIYLSRARVEDFLTFCLESQAKDN